MAEMSPGDKLLSGATRKLGHLKMAKVMFLIISAIVCIIIFYANTSVIGRRSLFALFLSNRNSAAATAEAGTTYGGELLTSPEKATTLPQDPQRPQNEQVQQKADFEDTLRYRSQDFASTTTRKRSRKSLIMKTLLVKPPSTRNASVQIFNLSSTVLGSGIGTASSDYNIFVIYTKENYQLHVKFELFIKSLLKFANSGVLLHLHVLTDETSGHSVDQILEIEVRRYRRSIIYSLYNMRLCAEEVVDIVNTMTPYFSSTPKSYYSDSLFFLSLGLHRIADENMERAILLDCDIVFRTDVRLLFNEFDRFSPDHLYGLAPELTPVYRHILYRYRANYPNTDFGSPFYMSTSEMHNMVSEESQHTQHKLRKSERHSLRHGYPGLNSGVVLLHLKRIRKSQVYHQQLHDSEVRKLTSKYMFKGHLGDQDFFTLLGYEFPNLIYRLDCVWNRQLCTWWKDHGYSDVFDKYFTCKGRIKMYHGNCNARVPE
ncbi:xyloside xylosyltransferase 1 [Lucilia sericata]|uniref:xyloside xylosyltransferase 1 n=1 Tax=Lucilia sericata TaxID=13632 RepID=UPI0018A86EA7|nr:xyloside xylosyltransferase 1 [Lucilia sericata]